MNRVVSWDIQVHSANRDYGAATIMMKRERGERREGGRNMRKVTEERKKRDGTQRGDSERRVMWEEG